jgi:hypothetical protein
MSRFRLRVTKMYSMKMSNLWILYSAAMTNRALFMIEAFRGPEQRLSMIDWGGNAPRQPLARQVDAQTKGQYGASVRLSPHARGRSCLRCCVAGRFGAAFPHGHHLRPNIALNRTRRFTISCSATSVAAGRLA